MGLLPPLCSLLLAGTLADPASAPREVATSEPASPQAAAPQSTPAPAPSEPAAPAVADKPDTRSPTAQAAAARADTRAETRAAQWRTRWSAVPATVPTSRRFMIGVEGLIAQAPPLRPTVVRLDPRSQGRTVALGGLGAFGRYRPIPLIGVEIGVRSSSLRYADADDDSVVSEDHVLADAGVLLYLARGEIAQFAFDAGAGGSFTRIGYETASSGDGTHTLGSGLVRVGADAEFLVKRVAFVLSLRMVGQFTDPARAKARGALFEGASAAVQRAPVPSRQTWLVASAGIGYRF